MVAIGVRVVTELWGFWLRWTDIHAMTHAFVLGNKEDVARGRHYWGSTPGGNAVRVLTHPPDTGSARLVVALPCAATS